MSDADFLRLKLILQSSLGITIEETELLTDSNLILNDSGETIKNLQTSIINLQSIRKQENETIERLSKSLTGQLAVSIFTGIGLFAFGFILGAVVF